MTAKEYELDLFDFESHGTSALDWKCPKCGQQNSESDIYESFDDEDNIEGLEVTCEGCEADFQMDVHGYTEWTALDVTLKSTGGDE
jgi:transcription elongation factor Elf1